MEFMGYPRPDGSAGARNYVAVIPAQQCANELANRIADSVGGAVLAMPHTDTCGNVKPDRDAAMRALVGLGSNPNIAGVVVVGVGCDGGLREDALANGIAESKKPVECFIITREGTYEKALEKGTRAARQMLADSSTLQREAFDISYLTLASKCTSSSPASILACNPAVGWAADRLVDAGGTFIFSETAETIGAEHLLARRGETEEVSRQLLEISNRMEERIKATGIDIRGTQPAPGNILGGMTTLEEKSLGAIAKSGKSKIRGALEWAERPPSKGMFFMDGSASTPQVFLGFAAAGAQVISLNFGGSTACPELHNYTVAVGWIPVVPAIKVLSSPADIGLAEYFDIFAGTIIEGKETIEEVGLRILEEVAAVASGKPARQEMYSSYREMLLMYTTGPLL